MITLNVEQALKEGVTILRNGGVIAYPTDTLYGLGSHYLSVEAVRRIYRVKGRPVGKGLPLLLSGVGEMGLLALETPPLALALAEAFWPGALTLVLKARPGIPAEITGEGGMVAVRVPDHSIPRRLAVGAGGPIIGTSANVSGGPDPITAQDVERALGDAVDCIVDGGPAPKGKPSTVVDLTGSRPRVARLGAVGVAELEAVMGCKLERETR